MKKLMSMFLACILIISCSFMFAIASNNENEQVYLTSDNFGDYFIGLKSISFIEGENIVVLSLDFSHSKRTKKTYYWNIFIEVTQNGIVCEKDEKWSSDNRHDEIKAGRIQAVEDAFKLRSGSPIEIEIVPGVNFATGEIIYTFDQEIPFVQSALMLSPATTQTMSPTPSPTRTTTVTPTPTEETCNFKDFGEQLSMIVNNDGVCVLKYKIKPSFNNEMTIKQNYYTVESFILCGGGDQYSEIQYWAVADMTDGSESKVISFTLSKQMIQYVKNQQVVALIFEDFLDDLWIHPCLQDE